MVAPTVELAEYYSGQDAVVYLYAFNHHRTSGERDYQAIHKFVYLF